MKKTIVSARRQNGQSVFLKDWTRNKSEMTEFQALAFDFESHYPDAQRIARKKINSLKEEFEGLMDWKIEEITC